MSYGFEFKDAAGKSRLKITEAMPCVVHSQRFAASYSGTFSVPGFDSDRGMFYYSSCIIKYRGTTRFSDSMALDSLSTTHGLNLALFAPNVFGLPDLSWNNTTKVMTVGPADLPSNWPTSPFPYMGPNSWNPDYWLTFLHTNLRFEVS